HRLSCIDLHQSTVVLLYLSFFFFPIDGRGPWPTVVEASASRTGSDVAKMFRMGSPFPDPSESGYSKYRTSPKLQRITEPLTAASNSSTGIPRASAICCNVKS